MSEHAPADDASDTYTHGHHASVVEQHARRTAESCAAHLLPHLRFGDRVLDAGCGPGSITVGLARAVGTAGEVVAFDVADDVLDDARSLITAEGLTNVVVESASVYELPYPDDSFDAAHAHQVLQHLTDPVRALVELRRVVRPGGVVAVRDADYGTMVHAPRDPRLDRWLELYHEVTRANGAEADAGRFLPDWFARAGFGDVELTATTWCFADDASRRNWGESWAVRALESGYASQALEYGLSTADELQAISDAWTSWADEPHGVFTFIHLAGLARV